MAINWNTTFAGFADVGTAIGDFVVNLVNGLTPAIILIAVLGGIVGIVYAVFIWVKAALPKKRG